ncbi:SRPBCC domain-containing protein [Dyadobacter flavalbus]|uniref:SRPBCC domain-containing protein n=1 Tax=Dyadobacter flavalbus TaxID=2579942 RepID=A0A5M8QSV0_9BACT|nr:SRPBCC domain-containing protein [Dyadobacter flavalbus]KAA6439189.1 SRPBCC domain-containing protein [Dyadobacter flavalbus]
METTMAVICPPDLSTRPYSLQAERLLAFSADVLIKAWTIQLDLWLASPASFLGKPEVNAPFYFETMHDGIRYPHYGRFLAIEQDKVELTWVSGENGTKGTETVLTITLSAHANGTYLNLVHAGFPDETTRDKHQEAWPAILQQLEERMSRPID